MQFFLASNSPTDPRSIIYAELLNQVSNLLSGTADGGLVSLSPVVAAPGAPAMSAGLSGNLNGTYQWAVYWITGVPDGRGNVSVAARTAYGALTTGAAVVNGQMIASIGGLTVPAAAIGWGLVRNKNGGGTWYVVPGSEQFVDSVGVLATTFTDNVADSGLLTAAPASNGTGTSFAAARPTTLLTGCAETGTCGGGFYQAGSSGSTYRHTFPTNFKTVCTSAPASVTITNTATQNVSTTSVDTITATGFFLNVDPNGGANATYWKGTYAITSQ